MKGRTFKKMDLLNLNKMDFEHTKGCNVDSFMKQLPIFNYL